MITIPDDTPAHELVILKVRVAELLAIQERNLIRPGKHASFIGRDGRKYYIRIDKVNVKSVTGRQCDIEGRVLDPTAANRGWRVSISMLTPVIAAPKVADSLPPPKVADSLPPPKVAADKPALKPAAMSDCW